MALRYCFSTLILPFIYFILISGCKTTGTDSPPPEVLPDQPEIGTGYTPKPGWEFSTHAVVAANPLASNAGYEILKAGGSAVDAAIAVQLVLSLVEPQSSGIGGGAFLLYWDGEAIQAFNGRETAPQGANEELFLDQNGQALPFSQAVNSGLSVGVPGTFALLHAAHMEYGTLPWADLFKPAIELAREGFRISPRLNGILQSDTRLRSDDIARALYYNDAGDALPAGHILKNPAYAEILQRVSDQGISAFYSGDIAASIADRVQNHIRPGTMTTSDLAGFPSLDLRTEAICTDWVDYRVCGFPPPSSGHIALMQILGILENLELPDNALVDGIPVADWLHFYMEAARLAFADRNQYIADPRFVDPPAGSWSSLLGGEYLTSRASLIGDTSMGIAQPGDPGRVGNLYGTHPFQPDNGTSHISIVDREGRAVSMTTTIEAGFGSRIMSDGGTGLPGGFHLNNELTDFSLVPVDDDGNLIANRVEPGKRPRSSMTPTLVFDRETGEFIAATGSPGGAAIIHYTAKSLIGMLQWNLNPQEAIDLPNFANYNGPAILESGYFPPDVIRELEIRGHTVNERNLTSGIHTVRRIPGGWYGGADPRREGVASGE